MCSPTGKIGGQQPQDAATSAKEKQQHFRSRATLLWAFEGRISPAFSNLQTIRSNHVSGWLIQEGAVRLRGDECEVCANAGEWLFCQARRLVQSVEPNTRLIAIHIRFPKGLPPRPYCCPPVLTLSAARHPGLRRAAADLLEIAGIGSANGRNPAEPMQDVPPALRASPACRHKVQNWLKALETALAARYPDLYCEHPSDPRLAAACEFLTDFPHEVPIRQIPFEDRVGLSLLQLNRLCLVEHGVTLAEFRQIMRLRCICAALEDPQLNIKEISFNHGFKQLSHFSVWFKKNTGCSPAAYRQKLLERTGNDWARAAAEIRDF